MNDIDSQYSHLTSNYKNDGFCKVEKILDKTTVDNVLNSVKNIAIKIAKENNITIESVDKNYVLNQVIPKIYSDTNLGSKIYDAMNMHVNTYNVFSNQDILKIIKVVLNDRNAEIICDNFQFFIHIPNDDEHILGWHQDSFYFKQFDDGKSLVCWIPLIDVGLEDGAIWVIPGSHKNLAMEHTNNVVGEHKKTEWNKKGLFYLDNKYFNDSNAVQILVNKRDIILMDFNLLHKSGQTRGQKVRYTILARFSRVF